METLYFIKLLTFMPLNKDFLLKASTCVSTQHVNIQDDVNLPPSHLELKHILLHQQVRKAYTVMLAACLENGFIH